MLNFIGQKLFVIVLPSSMPELWLAITKEDAYEFWFTGQGALKLWDVRALIMHPISEQQVELRWGPPYLGNTTQEQVALFPTSVEVIGQIGTDPSGIETCTDSQAMFAAYSREVLRCRAARINLVIAGPGDMPKGQPGSVTRLPNRK